MKLIKVLITVFMVLDLSAKEEPVSFNVTKLEVKADRAFICGDYDKAMKFFTQADLRMNGAGEQQLRLQLKIARLFILLQNPVEAIRYYGQVQQAASTMLTVNDVCFYIDALRQNGQHQQAEIVARQYAFLDPYSRNQRYLNSLHSLSNLQYYYKKGDSDYAVKFFEKNTSLPEFWVGSWKGKSFYALSHSKLQDPLKIFYHQTQYFSLSDEKFEAFRSIPRELQSGPVAFSNDEKLMIATNIVYNKTDRIEDIFSGKGFFVTQLYYSVINHKSTGWRRFEPLFELQEGFNYAHPAFFNDGKSLLFSSDRPGGYGGMDLYITHWDVRSSKWSEPVNLGPQVNTEGDEIFPRIIDNGLYFASNGLEGYGGYDIYRVSFGHNIVLPGSLFHYPYPINTTFNDFGIFFDGPMGYFISDRRGISGKDDIYTFDATISPLNSGSAIGVSAEYSAMAGNLDMIKGLKSSNTTTFEKELLITPTYVLPKEGEILLSVYFDFNKHDLVDKSKNELRELLDEPMLEHVAELEILGYADEFGTDTYNKRLSTRRAETVSQFMRNLGKNIPTLTIEGRGKLMLPTSEYDAAIKKRTPNVRDNVFFNIKNIPDFIPFDERVVLNRKLRRVDIIVKKNN